MKFTNFLKLFGMKDLDELPDLPRYRFDEKTIGKLLKIKWWDHEELHPLIESMFFDVNSFINKVGE